jgi:hypothetical protein
MNRVTKAKMKRSHGSVDVVTQRPTGGELVTGLVVV